MQEFQERNVFFDSTPLADADDYCRCRDWCVEDYDLTVWQPQPGARSRAAQAAPKNEQQVAEKTGRKEMRENEQQVAQWSAFSNPSTQPYSDAWQPFGRQEGTAEISDSPALTNDDFLQDLSQQEIPEQDAVEQTTAEQEAFDQDAPAQVTLAQETPEQATLDQEAFEQVAPDQEAFEQVAPDQEMLEQAAFAQESPEQAAPEQSLASETPQPIVSTPAPARTFVRQPRPRPCGCRGTGPINDMSGRRTPPAAPAYNDWLWPDSAPIQPAPLPMPEMPITPSTTPDAALILDTIDNASGYEEELVHI